MKEPSSLKRCSYKIVNMWFFDRVGQNPVGIQILKNSGIELKPILKKNGFSVFHPLRLTPRALRFTVREVRGNEICERKNK